MIEILFKKTNIKWINEIPNHWNVTRIGNIFKERIEKVSEKVYQPLSVTKSGIVLQLESAAKTRHSDNRKKVCKSDFVINSRSDRRGSGGIAEMDGSVSTVNIILKPSNILLSGFTKYLLTSKLFQDEFYVKGKGIVNDMWSTKFSEMKTIYLPVPPPSEQLNIARYLDSKSDEVKRFIKSKKRFVDLLREQRQSIINYAVTKGIDPKVRFKRSVFGDIPVHWVERRLASIGRFSKGGNISRSELNFSSESVPAILYGDIYTKYDIIVENVINRVSIKTALKSVELRKGDLLFTGSGETKEDIGKCIFFKSDIPAFAGGDIIIFKQYLYDSYFISYSQNSSIAKFQKAVSSKGDIIVHTYGSKLRDVRMPYPPTLDEQKQIVEHIKSETKTLDLAINKANREIELMKEYIDALIAEAVTGKLKL